MKQVSKDLSSLCLLFLKKRVKMFGYAGVDVCIPNVCMEISNRYHFEHPSTYVWRF